MGLLVLAAGSALDAQPVALLEAAAAAGFGGIGLRLSHGRMPGPAELNRIRIRADDLGIVIHDIEVHRVGDGVDPRHLIDATASLGAGWLLAVSDLTDETATIDAFGALSREAAGSNVGIGIEYMAWTTPNGPASAIRIANASGCVVVADVLHHHRVGAGSVEMKDIVDSGVLGWVQICDAHDTVPTDLLHEARHDRLPPGRGVIALDEMLAPVGSGTVRSVEVQSEELARMTLKDRARLLAHAATRWA